MSQSFRHDGMGKIECKGVKMEVLFCIHEEKMVLLHGFIKQTQKTPQNELEIALKRKQDLEQK